MFNSKTIKICYIFNICIQSNPMSSNEKFRFIYRSAFSNTMTGFLYGKLNSSLNENLCENSQADVKMLSLFLPILSVLPIIPSTLNRNIEIEIGLVFNKYINNDIYNLNEKLNIGAIQICISQGLQLLHALMNQISFR